jgi:shikimate kinase
MNIVLIGFMGTGKSAIGRALSRRLTARHFDTDSELERRFQMPVAQVFTDRGENDFREAETQILRRLHSQYRDPKTPHRAVIVSTGGGTPLRENNADLLRHIGVMIWLTAPTEIIVKRVSRNLDQRPLLAAFRSDPGARIEMLLEQRAPQYAALASYTVDTSPFETPDDAASHIISILKLNEEL